MFGSKQLLIAFLLGQFGVLVATGALSSKLDALELILFLTGLTMAWVSALFGPLFVLQERGVTRVDGDSGKETPGNT